MQVSPGIALNESPPRTVCPQSFMSEIPPGFFQGNTLFSEHVSHRTEALRLWKRQQGLDRLWL